MHKKASGQPILRLGAAFDKPPSRSQRAPQRDGERIAEGCEFRATMGGLESGVASGTVRAHIAEHVADLHGRITIDPRPLKVGNEWHLRAMTSGPKRARDPNQLAKSRANDIQDPIDNRPDGADSFGCDRRDGAWTAPPTGA
jgi:hypothetical protein